jgi:DNA polymerase-4
MGAWYADLGHGRGSAVVDDSPWIARGRSRERTFQSDLVEPQEIDREIRRLTDEVLQDVAAEDRPATRLTLKIRYRSFFTKTFSRTLPEPTRDPAVVLAETLTLVAKRELGRPIRLLGLRIELTMPDAEPDPVDRTPLRGRI